MSKQWLAILVGGLLPAVFLVLAGVRQKTASRTGIAPGPYLLTIGLVVAAVGAVVTLAQRDASVTLSGAVQTAGFALLWSVAVLGIMLGLGRYEGRVSVKATGRKTLIIAGVWTSVCVAFPALQAKAEGYNVCFVTDASGDPSPMASQTTIARLAQAGIIPMSTCAVFCEIQRTWRRPDAELYAAYAPNYRAAMESYKRAQDVARVSKK